MSIWNRDNMLWITLMLINPFTVVVSHITPCNLFRFESHSWNNKQFKHWTDDFKADGKNVLKVWFSSVPRLLSYNWRRTDFSDGESCSDVSELITISIIRVMRSDDGGIKNPWNVDKSLLDYKAQHPRSYYYTHLLLMQLRDGNFGLVMLISAYAYFL